MSIDENIMTFDKHVMKVSISVNKLQSFFFGILDEDLEALDCLLEMNRAILDMWEDGYLVRAAFLREPVRVEKIIGSWLMVLDRSASTVSKVIDSQEPVDADRGLFNLKLCIEELADMVPSYNIVNALNGEIKPEDTEELAKGVLPVYYRYQLLKALGIEKNLKQIKKAGDRERAIINLINCNEKTARNLYVGKYTKGQSSEKEEDFNGILSLLT
jgi:hypothetical protein